MGFKADRPFRAELFPAVVAHRGASATQPENTLPAFAAAIELGARFVELDVRLTADGEPVVIHDADVSRTTDGTGCVHELTLAELRALDAAPGRPERARVPTLAEVLAMASGRAGVVAEIKNLPGEPGFVADGEPHVEATLRTAARTGFEGPLLICSFNPATVLRARAAIEEDVTRLGGTEIATGLLVVAAVEPRDALAAAAGAGHGFVLPEQRAVAAAGAGFVEEAHAEGVRVGTWTVDDPAWMSAFLRMGVDAVATNDPAMGVAVRAEVLGAP